MIRFKPIKLIFLHHSCGGNWLADDHGGLGIALRDRRYFVSDTNYNWGPDSIGSHTDIGDWWRWFVDTDGRPSSEAVTAALYAESGQNCPYSRLNRDPGGENRVVMFKSCYPNSNLGGSPDDPPTTDDNPLRGQSCGSEHHTVGNAKGISIELRSYFATRQDKLFIAITAPPMCEASTFPEQAANARALNNWLVNEWLADYPYANVAVFDFHNVLTSNGGDAQTNDVEQAEGNHHRLSGGVPDHSQTVGNDYAAYGKTPINSHPTPAGNQKATEEFVPLLDFFYKRWRKGNRA